MPPIHHNAHQSKCCSESKHKDPKCYRPQFVLETFTDSLILCPINLDKFCGYDFKDGDIVAVEAEDMTSVACQENICGIFEAIPVKLFNIKRTWNMEIRQLRGLVQRAVDDNGISYHMIIEVTDLTTGDPTFKQTKNSLLFDPIVIYYEIHNILGQIDAETTMQSLEGNIIIIIKAETLITYSTVI